MALNKEPTDYFQFMLKRGYTREEANDELEKGTGGDLNEFLIREAVRLKKQKIKIIKKYQHNPDDLDIYLDFHTLAAGFTEQEALDNLEKYKMSASVVTEIAGYIRRAKEKREREMNGDYS